LDIFDLRAVAECEWTNSDHPRPNLKSGGFQVSRYKEEHLWIKAVEDATLDSVLWIAIGGDSSEIRHVPERERMEFIQLGWDLEFFDCRILECAVLKRGDLGPRLKSHPGQPKWIDNATRIHAVEMKCERANGNDRQTSAAGWDARWDDKVWTTDKGALSDRNRGAANGDVVEAAVLDHRRHLAQVVLQN
jgi:hypothetical protein